MTKAQEIDYAWKYWKRFRAAQNYREADHWLSYLFNTQT